MQQALRLVFSFLVLWATLLHAEIRIEINQGVDFARPIGIVPFQWSGPGPVPEDIGNIITIDLNNSGKFNPVDRSRLPQRPGNVREIQPATWRQMQIHIVILGQIAIIPEGGYNVSYQLVDTGSNHSIILTQNSYKVNKQWLRYAGHNISDEVFEKLTGIKGAFRTRIAYIVHNNNYQFPYELRISDYDGYNQFTVHRSPQPLMSPAWSPDGSKLAYVTFESGRSTIVIQTLSNGIINQVASFEGHNGAPAFSPDGTKLAFALSKTGNLNLYVMDIDSGQIHQVTSDRSNNTEPAWFPDSQNLIFTSDQAGIPQLYKININGGTPKRITWEGSQNQDADISADGKTMVMVITTNGQQHIAKQDLITGSVRILSSTFLDETPSLSPNGTMVIYSSCHGMGSALNLVSLNGRFKFNFPITNEYIKSPAWSPYL